MPTEEQRAVDLSYRALGRRERTVAELRTYLEGKRVEPEAIEHAVAELQAAGFLDDARYAARFAEDKRTLERWGSERIELDLRRRGVADDLIETAIAAQPRADELGAALELLAERMPQPPPDDRARDRAWRLLVRKGYEPELAYDAVRAHARRHAA
ncbi:MAG TPA: RecX family transcriptional regulator [Thermoleophilaceae bacterium]|nr:RecX family transcriptional regulator [Thermoleophilaceae bacterium]